MEKRRNAVQEELTEKRVREIAREEIAVALSRQARLHLESEMGKGEARQLIESVDRLEHSGD